MMPYSRLRQLFAAPTVFDSIPSDWPDNIHPSFLPLAYDARRAVDFKIRMGHSACADVGGAYNHRIATIIGEGIIMEDADQKILADFSPKRETHSQSNSLPQSTEESGKNPDR